MDAAYALQLEVIATLVATLDPQPKPNPNIKDSNTHPVPNPYTLPITNLEL